MDELLDRLRSALSDRYRIERKIGEGGMATVYLAHDPKHKRDVAIKVLDPALGDAVGAARFQREIEIAARLTHPHIVPLHDSGKADGLRFFVMPVISGGSLAEHLDGPLPPERTSNYVRAIAAGLDYAHAQGIVHRDLKPSNILLHEGEVMISDMGIAIDRGETEGTRFTQTGSSLGTPAYMSPEQLQGASEPDARSDVYALGCIAFEMLTGERPFDADTRAALAAKVLTAQPPDVSSQNPDVPREVDTVLRNAMAKAPSDRFESAGELARALDAALTPTATTLTRRRTAAVALVLMSIAAAAFVWRAGEERNRDAALAALQRVEAFVEAGRWADAFFEARSLTHPDAIDGLASLWPRFADSVRVVSDPPGATLSIRPYATTDEEWSEVGTTPLETRLPRAVVALRLEHEGYEPMVVNRNSTVMAVFGNDAGIDLAPLGSTPEGMVRIPAGVIDLGQYAAGLWGVEPLELGTFYIDRLEVSNAEYAEFVAAGAYEDERYWPEEMEVDGRTVTASEVAEVFVDPTGRPGPSTWELGAPPEGQEDHPVTGISWYEANAYARFVGKRLPTIYHWHRGVGGWMGDVILTRSNMDGSGTVPVGSTEAQSEFGLRDVAGNAREWVSTRDGDLPLTLGGGWDDDVTRFYDVHPQPAWNRSASNGIRLMMETDDDTGMAVADGPINVPRRDFFTETPVGDTEYSVYRRLFDYDDVELEPRIEEADTTEEWIRQEITFETGFSTDRMKIHLFVPLDAGPETQIILHFPGSGVLRTTQPLEDIAWTGEEFNFLVKTGRAVVYPVFLGMMERSDGFRYRLQDDTRAYRDHVITWGKEVRRTLDYLETRSDLNHDAIGYYGFSLGARMGAIMLAVDDRFQAGVLHSGGLSPIPVQPEADPFNYLPRVTQPVLMLNSQYDNVYPIDTSARPYLARLGTPEHQKELVVTEGGHFIPRTTLVRETLRWFDTYLSGR